MATIAPALTDHSARNTPTEIRTLRLSAIVPSALNPRKQFPEDALEELAASIREHGLLQPLIVRPHAEDQYVIVAGERRFHAAKRAGLRSVPVIVREMDDATHLQLALVENLQRRDLDPLEEAEGYRQLNKIVGMTQADIAAAVNRSQPAIANAMRLLELPDAVQEHIRQKHLSSAHGRALLKFAPWPQLCIAIAGLAIEEGVTSKRLEQGIAVRGGTGIQPYGLCQQGVLKRVENSDITEELSRDGITVWGERHSTYTPDVELVDAAVKRIGAALQAQMSRDLAKARERATAEGTKLLSIKKLPYESYERVGGYAGTHVPEGCTAACPCRAIAEDGGKPVNICTDPKRYKRLETAKAREEKKEHRAVVKTEAEKLDGILAAAPALDPRGLAIVVADRLWQLPKAVARRLLSQFAAGVLDDYQMRRDTHPLLATLPVESLVSILVHGSLLDSMSRHAQYGSLPVSLAWYMEGAGVDLLPATASELRQKIAEAQANIGDIRIQNQPGLCAQWQATLQQLEERLKAVRLSEKAVSSLATAVTTMSTDDARAAAWRYLRKGGYSVAKTKTLDEVQNGELLHALGERTEAQPAWDWPVIIAALKTDVEQR